MGLPSPSPATTTPSPGTTTAWGFVWEDQGDFIRDDSEIGKSVVERWEATCGMEWLG